MKETKYGLLHIKSKRLLGIHTSSNAGSDFCGEFTHTLDDYSDNEWLVKHKETAEYVRNYSTHWYNTEHSHPENLFVPKELEVVKVEVERTVKVIDVKIPSLEEWAKQKYQKEQLEHYEHLLKLIKDGTFTQYEYYDLCEYFKFCD